MKKGVYRKTAITAVFSAIIIICSFITIPAPVPITMQTLGVFLAVGLLPTDLALMSVLVYIMLGAVGLPVFSGFGGGVGYLLGQTGGYIFGFLALVIIAKLVLLFGKRLLIPALALGLFGCYFMGSLWFMLYTGAGSYAEVLTVTVLPFILPDIAKLLLSVVIINRVGSRLWK